METPAPRGDRGWYIYNRNLTLINTFIMNKNDNLGITIKEVRKNVGLSQVELSRRCGLSQAYLSQVENGHIPSIEALESIAKELGIPAAVISFISLRKENVAIHKQDLFSKIKPAMDELLQSVFNIPKSVLDQSTR